ncbi:hypothetical protein D1AOALGA4SA_5548 [Olavius algarvensis Delta 1 endosymbiont]|nr:hypothetical protein D1AOALGA4SA_5548 [Olavius algarvensis Delta 1 endosymbiont]
MYPSLNRSYKGIFPFKLCTTSFIYPDHYIPNVQMLGPYLDEIELLLFESWGPDVLPEPVVIAELRRLGAEMDLSYNVHLPTDVSIGDRDTVRQQSAVETMIRAMQLVLPLDPTALVLHIPYDENTYDEPVVANWRGRVRQNLLKLKSMVDKPHIIAIETLDYPLELIGDIVLDMGLTICLDLGHLMVYEYDLLQVFEKYGANTSVLHLHGVENGRDHLALDRLSDASAASVLQVLKRFNGVISLEVFSFDDLEASLAFIDNRWMEELRR